MDKKDDTVTPEKELLSVAGFVDTIREPLVVLDSDLRVISASNAFYSEFQLLPEHAVGSLLYDLNDRQWDIPKLRDKIDRILSSHTSFEGHKIEHEFEHLGKRTMLVNGSCLKTNSGGSPLILLAIEDITDRKYADEVLQMFKFSIDKASDMVLFINAEGMFSYVNEQACQTLGYTREELMHLYLWDIDPYFPKDRFDEEWTSYRKGQLGHQHIQTIQRRKNGREFPVEVFSKHIWIGDIEFHVAFCRDVTERKKAEEERIAHIRFLESLEHIDQATRRTSELSQMMSDALDALLTIFSCDRAFLLYPCDPDAQSWQVPMERTVEEYPGARAMGIEIPFNKEIRKIIHIVLEADGPVEFGLKGQLPVAEEDRKRFKIQSQLLTILYPKSGRPWILGLHQCSYLREWTQEEKSLFCEIGRQISDALTGLLTLRDLRESEERLRLALMAANQGLYDLNIQTGETKVSPEYASMLGYDPVKFKLTFNSWVESLHPNDRDNIVEVFKAYIRGDIPEYEVEFRQKTKTGGWLWILSIGKIVAWDADGNPLRMLGTHTDITKRKEAEEKVKRFQLSIDKASEAVFWMTREGGITYVNEQACRSLGYSRDELLQLYLWDIDPHFPKEKWQIQWEDVKKIGKRVFETKHRRKDGTLFPVEITSNHIEIDENVARIAYVRDITERKCAEEEKEKLESQLIQAQKMESIGRLAGGVAHDFNNMLSVIIGYTEMIKLHLSAEDPLMKDVLEIENAAIHSKDITSQLLAFSRKQIITPTVLDLNTLINTTRKTLSRLIGEDIDLRFISGKELWKIKFDPSQIEQILINLSVNARDAMPNGGKLTIETTNIHLDEDYCHDHPEFKCGYYVVLTVSDDGIGMDKETMSYIFEPFFTTKEVGKGTGLGLATVYGIIKQNNGFINIYSEPGQGTTFKIYIPGILEKDAELAETSDEISIVYGTGTILLVEDDDMVRRVAKTMLKSIGYKVLAAENPEKALVLCKKKDISIDLLITDVVMPGLSGAELRDKIEALRPGIRVLFMSGYTSDVIVHHGVLEKGVYFIHKPFTLNDLSRKVSEMLGKI